MIPAMRTLDRPISAVANSSRARAALFSVTHDIPFAAGDVGELLARYDVDAVDISAVNHLHVPHGIAAAAAGERQLGSRSIATPTRSPWSRSRRQ
jgi:predicted dehydrogenase